MSLPYRARGALIVDIRPTKQRARDGELTGAIVIDRNVLEWRLDPTSPHRIPEPTSPAQEIVLVCNEGYQSSLAAYTLQRLGLKGATIWQAASKGSLGSAHETAVRRSSNAPLRMPIPSITVNQRDQSPGQ